MGIWYIKATVVGQPDEAQAMSIAQNLGHVFTNGETGNTEITIYTMSGSLATALGSCIYEVESFCRRMGFHTHVSGIEAKSKVDRMTELAAAGITEDSAAVKLESQPQAM